MLHSHTWTHHRGYSWWLTSTCMCKEKQTYLAYHFYGIHSMNYVFKLATAAVLHKWLNTLFTAPFHVELCDTQNTEQGLQTKGSCWLLWQYGSFYDSPMAAAAVRIVASAHRYVLSLLELLTFFKHIHLSAFLQSNMVCYHSTITLGITSILEDSAPQDLCTGF